MRHVLVNFFQVTISDFGTTIFKAISTSLIITIVIRIIGLAKEATLAAFFGVSTVIDIYVLLLIAGMFLVGPLAGSFNTLLTRKLVDDQNRSGPHKDPEVVSEILILLLLAMGLMMVLVLFFMDDLLNYRDPSTINSGALAPIYYWVLPAGVCSTFTVVAGAVLTAERKFARQSVLPATVTITIILSCFIVPAELLVPALFLGTFCGYTLEASLALMMIRHRLHKPKFSWTQPLSPSMKNILGQLPPLVSAGVIVSGCVVVDQTMALLAGEGAVAMINFGSRVTLGLLSLVVVIWTVLFPHFIDKVVRRQYRELKQSFSRFVIVMLFGGLSLCLGLSLSSEWMTRLIFERGAFSAEDTLIVADIQAFYLLHIPFYMVIVGCGRILNALEKQQHFLVANAMLLGCNIVLNLFFINLLGIKGIALATLVSYLLMAGFWFAMTLCELSKACRYSQ